MSSASTIKLLVPCVPPLESLLPRLSGIDRAGWYTNFGPLSQDLEQQLARLAGVPDVVCVANGTLGLEIALACMDLEAGGYVLVPSLTFPATAAAVMRTGLVPLFGDVDERALALTPDIARRAMAGRKLAAVLTASVHGYVHDPADWDSFTSETGIPVLIDAAAAAGFQRIGATTSAVFSLHATKPIPAGEGGFIATRNPQFARRVRSMSNFGFDGDEVRWVGTNAKLSEYHAAVGLESVARWPSMLERRKAIFTDYVTTLAAGSVTSVATLSVATSNLSVRLRSPVTDRLVRDLAAAGIETRRWYWPPLHQHPAFADCPHADGLETTSRLGDRLLGLPYHLELKREDIARVCTAISRYAP